MVQSQPAGARVFLDGALAGTTPAQLSLPSDVVVRVVVLLEDHRIWTRDLPAAERPGQLDVTLQPAAPEPTVGALGKLRVQCPAGERWLYVDGVDVGRRCRRPQTLTLLAGRHIITARDPLTGRRSQQRVRVVRKKLLKLVLR
jgi:hypothetical protein